MKVESSRLLRELSAKDAIVIGLGSMIGAGIFAAPGPAAQAAGTGLLIAVILAGILAYFNATTMAQLAATFPESGGAYVYGRKQLGKFWGFLAGWGFVIGKLASCTAMALTFSYYAYPEFAKPLAISTVVILTIVNYLGVKKTALATKIIVALVLTSLLVVVISSLGGGTIQVERLTGWSRQGGIQGILEATGMMFFAFAGYARVATLGEEVIDPQNSIPKAILGSLAITIVIYLIVITSALLSVDISVFSQSKAPLAAAIETGRFKAFLPVVKFGACLSSIGVLLSLMAGVSRTVFAMSANRDLPHRLSKVHPIHKVPHRAELTVGLIIALVVGLADIREAIGFSAFAILTYYAIANASAWKLSSEKRMWPKWMSGIGFVCCVGIAFHLPSASIYSGVVLFLFGCACYVITHRLRNNG